MNDDRGTRQASFLFSLALAVLLALAACSPGGSSDSNVQVSSPTVEPQGKLSLHASATFEVSIKDPSGLYQAETLEYHWSLDEERATFLPEGADEATEVVTGSSSLQLRGDSVGAEVVRVTVVDTSTDTTIGVGTLAFEIMSPGPTSACFDSTTVFIRSGTTSNRTDVIDLETGERSRYGFWYVSDVSPDGNWVTGLTGFGQGNNVYVHRCDFSETKMLTDQELWVYNPIFSPDGKSVYFTQTSTDENPLFPEDKAFFEIAVADIASGEITVLTDLNANAQTVFNLAVSPDGEMIVFELVQVSAAGGMFQKYAYEHSLVSMPAGGGPLHTMTQIGTVMGINGITFAPDGDHVLFSWPADKNEMGERGLYRIHPTAGSGPEFLFADPSPGSAVPQNPRFYAGGTRIMWVEQFPGESHADIVSIDVNGEDLQRMGELSRFDIFSTVHDPY